MMQSPVWTLVTILVLTSGPPADRPVSGVVGAKEGDAVIPQCQVFLIDDVKVPAREAGALAAVSVREGNNVRAGQLLARIDDRDAQYAKLAAELKRDAALAKAEDDIEIRYSQASLGVADAELSQSEDINRRSPGTVSVAELRRLKLTRERAALQIDRSQLDVKVAGFTADIEKTAVAAAEDSIERRKITAPFDGMVLDLLRHEAEWVSVGEPVLRIIRLDRLRVEGFFQMRQYNPEEMVNRPVTIELERARGEKVRLPGIIVFVSPVVQAGDKYRVRAEVQNRVQESSWLLGPGMTVAMTIHTHDPPPVAAVVPSTR
jgi:macrolide-specific efflux system membrane fusion protein